MQKLKLDLEELAVETFDTTPVRLDRGTVLGHGPDTFQNTCMTCHTYCDCEPSSRTEVSGCGTCDASCGGSCDSCIDTCKACGTGVTACQYTCYPDPC